MKQIFKKVNSGAVAGKETVGDYNFKNHYPDINRAMAWSDLEPYIFQAVNNFILPFIGQPIYDDICTKVEANTALNPMQTIFLENLRDAIAYHTVAVALPKKATTIAAMGAVQNVATEGTTGTALWAFRTTLWSTAQDADRNTDRLLTFMEARVKASDTYFDLWKNDPAYLAGVGDLFRTTADFQQYRNINSSRRTFLAMLSLQRDVQRRKIQPILGSDQLAALVALVKTGGGTDKQKELLDLVRAASSAWTVFHAADGLPILPDQDGFRVIGNADAVDTRAYSAEVTQSAIARMKANAEESARTATADIVVFLANNSADFPLWADSASNPANDTTIQKGPISTGAGAVFI